MTARVIPVRSRRQRARAAVIVLVASAAVLWLTLAVVPGVDISTGGWWSLVTATLVIALASAIVRLIVAIVFQSACR